MKLLMSTLDEEVVEVKIDGKVLSKRSALHLRARALLKEKYPLSAIFEEVYLPVASNKKLPFDFFIPSLSLMVEVQGEQHFKFIQHFHKTKVNFLKAKVRDKNKKDFCELNDITIVYLNYDETDEEWILKI